MATTDILPYAGAGGANVDTQVTYAGHSYLTTGLANGAIVPAQFFNKILRQTSFMSAGVANWLVNLGINVPDDGNLTNLIAEIQSAHGAILNKSVAGGTDVTLNVTTEANYPVINLTGLLTANINVITPTGVPSKWIFQNSTTGNFSVTVKTAAGTGVVVPQGSSKSLFSEGTNVYSATNGTLLNIQIFNTAGTFTYTPTAGALTAVVEVLGGGGGGGGSASTGAGQISAGAGGGAGGYGRKRILSGLTTTTVTVGAFGGGGSAGASGSAGGTSSFGAIVSCTGGNGGAAGVAGTTGAGLGAAGGTSTGGDLNITGQSGDGPFGAGSIPIVKSGKGANSQYGAGGTFQVTFATGGAASGFGSGGGGSADPPSQGSPASGGNGAIGLVIVWEYA